MAEGFSVSELARRAGVTVRTLHHYDQIGLLRPSRRMGSGYRHYDQRDAQKLQRILVLRELGLPLDEVRELVSGDPAGVRRALAQQRERVRAELERLGAVLRALDVTLASERKESTMDELFAENHHFAALKHERETRERYAPSPLYAESQRRTREYGSEDWARMREEESALLSRLARLLEEGRGPGESEVEALVEQHRLHIDRWFYPCDREQHARLASLYTGDERFASHFDRHAPGLASFLARAIQARAGAAGGLKA